MEHTSPHQLINGLLEHTWSSDTNGYLLNDLLDHFHRGFPVANVLTLIESSDEQATRAGTWIASELGTKACKIYKKIKPLVKSPDPKVRFNIASCILVCADEEDGESIIDLTSLLHDQEAFVRWISIDSLCRLQKKQVLIATNWLRDDPSADNYYRGFKLLYDCERNFVSIEQIKVVVRSQDLLLRKFAVIAAIRKQFDHNAVQELANLSADEDIIDFCSDIEISDYKS
jgi:hypothetical protein